MDATTLDVDQLQAKLADTKQAKAVVESKLSDSESKLSALKSKLSALGITDFSPEALAKKLDEFQSEIKTITDELANLEPISH